MSFKESPIAMITEYFQTFLEFGDWNDQIISWNSKSRETLSDWKYFGGTPISFNRKKLKKDKRENVLSDWKSVPDNDQGKRINTLFTRSEIAKQLSKRLQKRISY